MLNYGTGHKDISLTMTLDETYAIQKQILQSGIIFSQNPS
jgi:hypothetical protein